MKHGIWILRRERNFQYHTASGIQKDGRSEVNWISSEKRNRLIKILLGSTDLADELVAMNIDDDIGSITFVGLCTDICVISNALLVKASLPENSDHSRFCMLCRSDTRKS